jgi:site-specific DNA-methyltransferase (adenine-specific)
MKLILGDSVDKLKELDDNSIDSIVTDPPYGLSFMGKKWDYDVPSQEIFEECLRVLKPGGYLLSFAGSRTYHRMAVRVEDAGFEIRDQIMWIYGSGFPKSMNIGKAMDKVQGNEREVVGKKGGKIDFSKTKKGDTSFYETAWDNKDYVELEITKGNSPYEGWGTALKPAHEPIVMARKPLSEKTVVNNVLEWGTGGINIDASRVGTDDTRSKASMTALGQNSGWNKHSNKEVIAGSESGRFPANIIFDEEAGKILDEQSGISKSTGGRSGNKEGVGQNGIYGQYSGEVRDENPGLGDIGGASRFFYCPKTSKKDRNEGLEDFKGKQIGTYNAHSSDLEIYGGSSLGAASMSGNNKMPQPKQNFHPTVKPTDLMLYLIRLVTPKGGTTLDPFMGSGSTGKAAVRGGFDFIGIEREKEYMEIAEARIQYEKDNPYNEETKTRINVKKEVNEKVNKFFNF